MDPLSPELLKNILNIVIIVICLVLSAFFAAGETAYSKCNRYKLQVDADDNKKRAKMALKILDNIDKSIVDTLIWINILHIVSSTIATILFVRIIPLDNFVVSLISTVVMTILIFFFSEILPKNISALNPEKSAKNLSYFLYIFGLIVYPVSFVLQLVVTGFKKLFRLKEDSFDLTEDDFQDTVEDIEDQGLLEDTESEIIQNAVDFSDFKVKDVMVKIEDVVMIEKSNCSKNKLLPFLKDLQYSRLPVFEIDKNNIIGVLNVKKYLRIAYAKDLGNFNSLLSKPIYVKKNLSLDDMMDKFQQKRCHMAFVKEKDEIIGLVTMEDVVEKLVGDIDEVNPPKVEGGDE